MADGGEGTLAALGGANQTLQVQGPLGAPVNAEWRLHRGTAVIEMALSSGLQLVGGAEHNDPIAASTIGTGQLIDAALNHGINRLIVCLGGSATTDGGLGAVNAITTPTRLKRVEFLVACDVETRFLDAAEVFAEQKGATATHIRFLTTRLAGTAEHYRQRFDVDVTAIDGGGAAGGLAGGLHALGATLLPGFEIVADEVGLHEAIDACDVVITGEGRLDDTSFAGKVVGGVAALARAKKLRSIAICGEVTASARKHATRERLEVFSLLDEFGAEALTRTSWCMTQLVERLLRD